MAIYNIIIVLQNFWREYMKIRVFDKNSVYYNMIFSVDKASYEKISCKYDDKDIVFNFSDVELIGENVFDELVISYRELLKINLKKEMSHFILFKLISCLEETFKEKIDALEVIKDKDFKIKKGFYDKRLILLVNKKNPVQVNIIGTNYSKNIDIDITRIEQEEFYALLNDELEKINLDISKSLEQKNFILSIIKPSLELCAEQ